MFCLFHVHCIWSYAYPMPTNYRMDIFTLWSQIKLSYIIYELWHSLEINATQPWSFWLFSQLWNIYLNEVMARILQGQWLLHVTNIHTNKDFIELPIVTYGCNFYGENNPTNICQGTFFGCKYIWRLEIRHTRSMVNVYLNRWGNCLHY